MSKDPLVIWVNPEEFELCQTKPIYMDEHNELLNGMPRQIVALAARTDHCSLALMPTTPPASQVQGEREAFEAWRLANFCGGEERLRKCSNAPDVYYYTSEQEAWKVWQARAALSAPPAAGVLEQMSPEARSTLVGMVEFCLNRRYCMGMNEGFASFDPDIDHDFVKELRAFAEAAPTPPAAGTTSDQYRAELYDEVWQKARDMGYGNVTNALVDLERIKAAPPAAGVANASVRRVVTDALVSMVSGLTRMSPPPNEPLPDFIQAPIDRAVERIVAELSTTPPASEQQQAVVMPELEQLYSMLGVSEQADAAAKIGELIGLQMSRNPLTEAQMQRLYSNSSSAENEGLGFAAFARLMRRAEAVHKIASGLNPHLQPAAPSQGGE